jgi:type II secretory pathway component PulM
MSSQVLSEMSDSDSAELAQLRADKAATDANASELAQLRAYKAATDATDLAKFRAIEAAQDKTAITTILKPRCGGIIGSGKDAIAWRC